MIYLISSPEGEDTNFIGLQREDGKAPNIVQGGPEPSTCLPQLQIAGITCVPPCLAYLL